MLMIISVMLLFLYLKIYMEMQKYQPDFMDVKIKGKIASITVVK